MIWRENDRTMIGRYSTCLEISLFNWRNAFLEGSGGQRPMFFIQCDVPMHTSCGCEQTAKWEYHPHQRWLKTWCLMIFALVHLNIHTVKTSLFLESKTCSVFLGFVVGTCSDSWSLKIHDTSWYILHFFSLVCGFNPEFLVQESLRSFLLLLSQPLELRLNCSRVTFALSFSRAHLRTDAEEFKCFRLSVDLPGTSGNFNISKLVL